MVRDLGGAGELGGWWVLRGAKVWEEKGGRWVEMGSWGSLLLEGGGGASWVMAEWPGGSEGDLGGEGRWPAFPGLCDLSGEDLEKRRAWGHTGDSMGRCEGPVLCRG